MSCFIAAEMALSTGSSFAGARELLREREVPFEVLPPGFFTRPRWVQRSRGVKQLLGAPQNLDELAAPHEFHAPGEPELLRKAPRAGPEIGGESHT